MDAQRFDLTKSSSASFVYPPREEQAPSPRAVFEELFQLLEDYAPRWYTEEHRNRAVAALCRSDW